MKLSTITLDMKKGSRQTCKGYYDCFDLPEGWAAVTSFT